MAFTPRGRGGGGDRGGFRGRGGTPRGGRDGNVYTTLDKRFHFLYQTLTLHSPANIVQVVSEIEEGEVEGRGVVAERHEVVEEDGEHRAEEEEEERKEERRPS
ncbi:hypothetical protein MMC13_007798 [Lambiella insularis]|nr:hypothetical protein [Lambiella insularis]